DLAVAEHKLGSIFNAADRPGDALRWHAAAHATMAPLSAENPDNVFYKTSTLLPLERVANCQRLLGRHAEARSTYREAIALARHIHESSTSDVRPWTALATSQRGIGLSLLAEAEAAQELVAADLRREAAEWFSACLESIAQMESIDMTPTRGDLNREALQAL